MNAITDFRIDTVEIPESLYYDLPAEVRKLIESYASPLKPLHPDVLRFELPIYHWEEINAAIKRLMNAEF